MEGLNRKDIILLMLGTEAGTGGAEGLNGITRLQKFLYLLEEEEKVEIPSAFQFVPYKAGPYSATLYDDLEFLENLGLLRGEVAGETTEEEAAEVDLTFEELIGDASDTMEGLPSDAIATPDAYEERIFELTEAGQARVEQLLKSDKYKPVVDRIRKIKSDFGSYSLNDLLYYVYTRHPEMTTESEIKEKILRRGRRK